MSIVLNRIDDRLIHGQVVIGWGRPLGIDLIVLVDDQVAASPWEQDLYRMAVPPGIEVIFASVPMAVDLLGTWETGPRRGLVLTGNIETMAALHAAAPAVVRQINLGGLHHRPGRRERLPYLYLTDDELGQLRALEAHGAVVSAQDVPTAPRIGLRAIA